MSAVVRVEVLEGGISMRLCLKEGISRSFNSEERADWTIGVR